MRRSAGTLLCGALLGLLAIASWASTASAQERGARRGNVARGEVREGWRGDVGGRGAWNGGYRDYRGYGYGGYGYGYPYYGSNYYGATYYPGYYNGYYTGTPGIYVGAGPVGVGVGAAGAGVGVGGSGFGYGWW
jgi:hypothetical protein